MSDKREQLTNEELFKYSMLHCARFDSIVESMAQVTSLDDLHRAICRQVDVLDKMTEGCSSK